MKTGKTVSGMLLILLIVGALSQGFLVVSVQASDIIIDTHGDSRFTKYPSGPYWWSVSDHDVFHTRAYANNFWYTYCGDAAHGGDLYFGMWTPSVIGEYEVFVWIPNPDPFGTYTPTHSANYQIWHSSGLTERVVNQALRLGGWYSLGSFTFDASSSIILNDRTGEPYVSTMVAFDAVKFVAITPPTPTVHLESRQDNGATSNLGTMAFDGIQHGLPEDVSKAAGTYQATYYPTSNYMFDEWETSGSISVSSTASNPTSVTVSGSGTLRALYREIPQPTYSATISAYCNTDGVSVNVGIVKDGSSTGYNTPHTFTGLTGTYTFTVPNADASGHPFINWNTGQTSTTITVSSAGTYTAYYQGTTPLPNPPTLVSPGSTSSPGEEIYTLTPTFKWDSVSGADQYGLYIRDIDTNTLIFDSRAREITIAGTSYTIPSGDGGLQWGGHYRWNMNSHNEAGWGEYCSPLYFQVAPEPPQAEFSISASPTSLAIQQGGSGSSTIIITSINGFSQPVQLSVSGAPSGVTATFSLLQVTPPASGTATSTLAVSVATTATPGSYIIRVSGASDDLTHDVDISLEVTLHINHPPDPPHFLLQYSDQQHEIRKGESTESNTITFIGSSTDPDGDRIKLQVEVRRTDELGSGFTGVPTCEGEFINSPHTGAATAVATDLTWGFYHWQARFIDESGHTSGWISYPGPYDPINPESEADFSVRCWEFLPSYEKGSCGKSNYPETIGDTSGSVSNPSVSEVNGEGKTDAIVFVQFLGASVASSSFTLQNTWQSGSISGTYYMDASFLIDGVIGGMSIAFPGTKAYGKCISSILLKTTLSVFDVTDGIEISHVENTIYSDRIEWYEVVLPWPPIPKAVHYSNAPGKIQCQIDLQQQHEYRWSFSAEMTLEVSAAGVAGVYRECKLQIKLPRVGLIPTAGEVSEAPNPVAEDVMYIAVGCPVNVLVVDPEGKHIGFDSIHEQEVNEIPDACFDRFGEYTQLIRILNPVSGRYVVLLSGLEEGSYTLAVAFAGEENAAFRTAEIPTSTKANHQYTIDRSALSQGEEGVAIAVDSNGDDVFEHTFTSDSELTQGEFLAQTTLLGDMNLDGVVDLMDAIQASAAFGSYPGHPDWNAMADINGDGVIDIYDFILLANNFGMAA